MSRLLFADDCLVFCSATIEQVQAVKLILDQYERASGQQVTLANITARP